MQRQARDVERREHEARQLALAAQLQALQARTNPHFLFNSLNTVASLIPTDPELAELTLVRLAELFRYALHVSTRSRVTLDEELDATRDYLRVESLRLGDRLRWEVDVQAGLERVPTPPLLLQPLVENAIVHGVSRERSGGTVRVVVRAEPRDVVFEVHDDGSGRSDRVGTGTALDDLRKRLELCYGGRAQLERKVGDGHVVCVRIPREEGLCAR
ncbi:MAG: histidine kinase [Polyangiaceae bacterium]